MINSCGKYLLLGIAVLGWHPMLRAVPQLRLFDGTTTLTVTDNDGNDLEPMPGSISYSALFGNWNVNVFGGMAGALPLNPTTSIFVRMVFDITSTSDGGTLNLLFSVNDFRPAPGNQSSDRVSGVVGPGGSLLYQSFGGTNNTNFSAVNVLNALGPFGAGAFSSGQEGMGVQSATPYALTEMITVTHGAGTIRTSGFAVMVVPDSGPSLALFASSMCFLAGCARFLRR